MFSNNAILGSLLLCCIALSVVKGAEYDTKYDNVDLDEIFRSTRLLNNYMKCLKNLGPCTPEGKELKENLPDALSNDCAKCSEKQKAGASKVIHFIVENRRDDFGALEKLYDPTGEFRRKYLDEEMNFRPHGEDGAEEKSPESESGGVTTEEAAAAAQDHGQSAEGRR
uniref:Putative insect pheromone-binding family n=1 Tax=Culex tarsalis TaxID=7177 RepID=A0A1Q3FSS0_CULTA